MNLEKLFSLMLKYNMQYFTGHNTSNMKEFDFSTGYNGKGSSVNIEIHNIPSNHNIDLLICHNNERFEFKSLDEEFTIKHINNKLNDQNGN